MRTLPLAALPVALLVTACTAGHRVYHASVAPAEAHGVYYALPRAVLEVDVDVGAFHEVRGTCSEETALKATLGLAPPQAAARPARAPSRPGAPAPAPAAAPEPARPAPPPRLELSASVGGRAEADPDEVYLVDLRGRRFRSSSASIGLTRGGVLTGATITAENTALETTIGFVGAGLDLTTKALGAAFAGDDRTSACGLFANRIKEIRAQRQAIYGGTWQGLPGGIPRDSLDRILTGLDAQEAALTRLFVVAEEIRRGTIRCTVTPRAGDTLHARSDGRELVFPLLSVDRSTGSVAAADPTVHCVIPPHLARPSAGTPAQQQQQQQQQIQQTPDTATVHLTLQLHGDDLASRVDPELGCKEREGGRCTAPQGLYYRVPRQVTALVWWATDRAEILGRQDLQVPQLGVTLALPAGAIKRRSDQGIELYPDTGGLKTLNASNQSISGQELMPLVDKAGRVIDTAAGAASRDDELGRLERERTLLEEQVRIKEARDKLGLDTDGSGGGSGGAGGRGEFPPRPTRADN